MLEEILASTFRLGIPLILVAYSGLLSERSGVANIALEAQLIFSAFSAAAITSLYSSPVLGLVGGIFGAMFVAAIFAAFCIHGKGDDIVVGTGMNIFIAGLVPILSRSLFSVTGSTPSIPLDLRLSVSSFAFCAIIFCFILTFIFKKTVWGLRVNAAGENPDALVTQGISAVKTRYQAVIAGGALAGFGGAYISICQSSGYVRNMSAGRGFMALAALILGGWKPIPTACACLCFALFDAVQMRLQEISFTSSSGIAWTLPNQFVQILPFVVTLAGLAFFGARMKAPSAINKKLDI